MGDNSKIEWTEATWNPVTGCTKVSQGCKNCYAEGMAKRLQAMGQERYRNGFKVTLQDGRVNLSGIHWAIVGGESGPNARPMSPEWAREIRDRCQIFGTNFFFKQWGEWAPLTQSKTTTNTLIHTEFGLTKNLWMAKVGKHKAGRILDGRTWDEMLAR